METQYTPIRVPSSSKLYIFGSALTSISPNDLDVLIIYDPFICPPEDAYRFHSETIFDLETCYGLPVHLSLLTPSEESGTDFIGRTRAIEFAVAQRGLTHCSTRTLPPLVAFSFSHSDFSSPPSAPQSASPDNSVR